MDKVILIADTSVRKEVTVLLVIIVLIILTIICLTIVKKIKEK